MLSNEQKGSDEDNVDAKTSDESYVDEDGDEIPGLVPVCDSYAKTSDGDLYLKKQNGSIGDNVSEDDMNSIYDENLPHAKTSDDTYVDEDGDEIPGLVPVCDSYANTSDGHLLLNEQNGSDGDNVCKRLLRHHEVRVAVCGHLRTLTNQ